MKIGLIGLGRMGFAVGHRLIEAGHDVIGFDPKPEARVHAVTKGIACVNDMRDFAGQSQIFWLMVPSGAPVDMVLTNLDPVLQPGDIVIDGGNSFYKDSQARAQKLAQKQIMFLDCGTSGGLHGHELGFSLMIGGDQGAFEKAKLIFESIAASSGYAHVGPSGAGHFVKMVHNGIEYAMLQAYAEGFHVLKEGPYKDLDLQQISAVWNHGAIVRSWLLELAEQIFSRDQNFTEISGSIGENKTGVWTVQTAKELGISVDVIEESLKIRQWSRQTGGNYATKLVALLRNEFGGHEVKKQ